MPRALDNPTVVEFPLRREGWMAVTTPAAFVHIAPGTVAVVDGQSVSTGDVIGRIGHTGNSTSPHLHFQLMDSADPMTAQGIACAFRAYEVERDGSWIRITNAIPGRRDRLRLIEPDIDAPR